MRTEDKSFLFRISLEAQFPDDYEGPHDENAWLREWELQIKPAMIKHLFETLREYPAWKAHVRNRGILPRTKLKSRWSESFLARHNKAEHR